MISVRCGRCGEDYLLRPENDVKTPCPRCHFSEDPERAFRMAQGQAALQRMAESPLTADLSLESLQRLVAQSLTDSLGYYRDMFGPPAEIWPEKSWLQDRLETLCDRILLVWDALLFRIQSRDGYWNVEVRCTDLDRLFGRRPSPNPEYEVWLEGRFESRQTKSGETFTIRRPVSYQPMGVSDCTDELRWADDGGAIA